MHITPGNAQHLGQRTSQQDAFGFSDTDDPELTRKAGVLAVVADGMGGLALGAEASRLAVKAIIKTYAMLVREQSIPEALDTALLAADSAVAALARAQGEPGNVGTTVVAVVVHEGALFWRAAGDSRLYLWRKPYFSQVTTDHDYGRLLDQEAGMGLISHEQAQRHPDRRALTSYVGQDPVDAVDANRRPLALLAGDQLLLCSDGLYNSLDNGVMGRILEQSQDPHVAAENLVEQAIAQQLPHQDNITALVMLYDDNAVTVRSKTAARKPTVLHRLRRIWPRKTWKPS